MEFIIKTVCQLNACFSEIRSHTCICPLLGPQSMAPQGCDPSFQTCTASVHSLLPRFRLLNYYLKKTLPNQIYGWSSNFTLAHQSLPSQEWSHYLRRIRQHCHVDGCSIPLGVFYVPIPSYTLPMAMQPTFSPSSRMVPIGMA